MFTLVENPEAEEIYNLGFKIFFFCFCFKATIWRQEIWRSGNIKTEYSNVQIADVDTYT
jgi:hypothetical protein